MHTPLRRSSVPWWRSPPPPSPPPARADRFEIEWDYYRWSWGFVRRRTGLPDLDPSENRQFYADAVGSSSFRCPTSATPGRVDTVVTSRRIEYTPFTCGHLPLTCYRTSMVFDLGTVFADRGDTGDYTLKTLVPVGGPPVGTAAPAR